METTISKQVYEKRVKKSNQLMIAEEVDVLLLTKPSNMYYCNIQPRDWYFHACLRKF
jgi:hypothetical protein